ncbi:UNVERIFIED_CONTAM: hypothetical protein K2H54_002104 [Gekko kuhli]
MSEIEVPVGEPVGEGGEGDEEEDSWSRRLDFLERGQLHLQRHLEEAMRAIPKMVIRILAAEWAAGEQQPAPGGAPP